MFFRSCCNIGGTQINHLFAVKVHFTSPERPSVTTTPPAPMLSKKFFSDGETPLAASATSGTIMEAVNAAAVNPVTAFSFNEALISNFPADFDTTIDFDFLTGNALRKESEIGCLFCVARVNGIAMDTADVEAIVASFAINGIGN
ncbi:hypothetical protein ACJIZ3_021391 [Penstemon smallii]|uniref:Uncharacterized protein n=1 Tax=Penstemon smallii TaxID=265156 RepID=A0ABD3SLA2_9LAMI